MSRLTNKTRYKTIGRKTFPAFLFFLSLFPFALSTCLAMEIPGCSTGVSADYSCGFITDDFDFVNADVQDGRIYLQTGQQAINPESIIIPFTQEVNVTFLCEIAGYVSDFGWILKDDAVDANGSFKGWDNIDSSKRHPIFHNINDYINDYDMPEDGGNGIFDTNYGNDSFPTGDENDIASYNDGTGLSFAVDGDGSVTAKDMKKVLGTFDGGTELVFFLTANQDWDTTSTNGTFFTKKDWNPDTYQACGSGTFDKLYHLGQTSLDDGCTIDGGWLSQITIDRLSSIYDLTLSGNYTLPITMGQKFAHVIVGAPDNDPNQWILGWEDLMHGGDADHNDMVFKVERRTGGTAELKSSMAISPTEEDAYFTAVTLEVYDNIPCPGQTGITYYLSIDNGANWVEVTNWDIIKNYTIDEEGNKTLGSDVSNWTPGNPQYAYRSSRLDFAGMGLSGREIIWKAELASDNAACVPRIVDVLITGSVATHGFFSRSSPVVAANVLYSGSYETPAISWTDKVLRGHLNVTRIYDPSDPTTTNATSLWDAGAVLNSKEPSARNIYYPCITVSAVAEEVIGVGDNNSKPTTVTFSGTLAHHPISATTINITDQTETFTDIHTDVLQGSLGGTGTINRFTGAFEIVFNTPPGRNVPIKACYSYYTTSSTLTAFNTSNVSNSMLSLDDTYIFPGGYIYDMDNDGNVDEDDGDWLVNWVRGYKDGAGISKEWLLGAIDHSVPAVATPPGKPGWYYGTAITSAERQSFDTFLQTYVDRQTVVYVGARDGMLHAFDAGKFRWGDNNATGVKEHRGYFLWEGDPSAPNYGTGEELWAFIPANLIPRLKNNLLQGDDQAYVDASPAISDVYIDGTWKTILLCAEGNGGDTVFCLDITDPACPSFLWEFSDPDLFRSRSSPAIAKIGRILVDGSTRWVAFFVSGKTYDPNLYPSIYVIDVSDGSVIERVFLDAEPGGIGGVPSGQPAIVDSDGNGYIDRIYIGTDKGYMYKVNIPDDPDLPKYDISQCVINTDYTDDQENTVLVAQQGHPIYASPTVVVDNHFSNSGEITYDIKIFFGTGDSPYYDEDINISETQYHFFAYRDRDQKGGCDESAVFLDWFVGLPPGHRIFASAFAAAGNIYFGTATAETEDPCAAAEADANKGRIYGYTTEGDQRFSSEVGNIIVSPLVEDQHLYFKTPSGLTSLGSGQYNNEMSGGGTADSSVSMWREVF